MGGRRPLTNLSNDVVAKGPQAIPSPPLITYFDATGAEAMVVYMPTVFAAVNDIAAEIPPVGLR